MDSSSTSARRASLPAALRDAPHAWFALLQRARETSDHDLALE